MDHVQFYGNKEPTLNKYLTLFEGQTWSKTGILCLTIKHGQKELSECVIAYKPWQVRSMISLK